MIPTYMARELADGGGPRPAGLAPRADGPLAI